MRKPTKCPYCGEDISRVVDSGKRKGSCLGSIMKFVLLIVLVVVAVYFFTDTKTGRELKAKVDYGLAKMIGERFPNTRPIQTATPTPAAEVEDVPDGIRPEVKAALDEYESYMNSYIEFLTTYDASDATMLVKYMEFLSGVADASKKLDSINHDLTDEESLYLLHVTNSINERLIAAAVKE